MFFPTKCTVKYAITDILRQIQYVANSFSYVKIKEKKIFLTFKEIIDIQSKN